MNNLLCNICSDKAALTNLLPARYYGKSVLRNQLKSSALRKLLLRISFDKYATRHFPCSGSDSGLLIHANARDFGVIGVASAMDSGSGSGSGSGAGAAGVAVSHDGSIVTPHADGSTAVALPSCPALQTHVLD